MKTSVGWGEDDRTKRSSWRKERERGGTAMTSEVRYIFLTVTTAAKSRHMAVVLSVSFLSFLYYQTRYILFHCGTQIDVKSVFDLYRNSVYEHEVCSTAFSSCFDFKQSCFCSLIHLLPWLPHVTTPATVLMRHIETGICSMNGTLHS